MPSFAVDPASLEAAGGQLRELADQLTGAVEQIRAELSEYAAACGGDEIGALIAATGTACAEAIFGLIDDIAEEIGLDGDDLGVMAASYRAVDATNAVAIQQSGSGLGV